MDLEKMLYYTDLMPRISMILFHLCFMKNINYTEHCKFSNSVHCEGTRHIILFGVSIVSHITVRWNILTPIYEMCF